MRRSYKTRTLSIVLKENGLAVETVHFRHESWSELVKLARAFLRKNALPLAYDKTRENHDVETWEVECGTE